MGTTFSKCRFVWFWIIFHIVFLGMNISDAHARRRETCETPVSSLAVKSDFLEAQVETRKVSQILEDYIATGGENRLHESAVVHATTVIFSVAERNVSREESSSL